ncbi:MAG: lipoyl synthase [Desulfonatronovibrio sp.]|nr:lipoyl synthase [Desulfovibrionales bacterium]
MPSEIVLRKPRWLRVKLPSSKDFSLVDRELKDLQVGTVCRSAQCPNIFECFSRKVATFLILGPVCSRRCTFCDVPKGDPQCIDSDEPAKISQAVHKLKLRHIVITSVTRDDLDDGGAGQFSKVISRLRNDHPSSTIEILIPDFQGKAKSLDTVIDAGPDVIGHNMETVRRLYPRVRPVADYDTSLNLLKYISENSEIKVKTGIMVGLGESDGEVLEVLEGIAGSGCDLTTIGQYLRPGIANLPVDRYVNPDIFEEYAAAGKDMGLKMLCGPLVRSSYHAEEFSNCSN